MWGYMWYSISSNVFFFQKIPILVFGHVQPTEFATYMLPVHVSLLAIQNPFLGLKMMICLCLFPVTVCFKPFFVMKSGGHLL